MVRSLGSPRGNLYVPLCLLEPRTCWGGRGKPVCPPFPLCLSQVDGGADDLGGASSVAFLWGGRDKVTRINFTGFNGAARLLVLSANWPPATQLLDDDGVKFQDVGVRDRNLLKGIEFRNERQASVSIDLIIAGGYHYLHVNIHNSTKTQIPKLGKKSPGGAGDKTKGTVYCCMGNFTTGAVAPLAPPPFSNVVIKQCNEELIDGKVEPRSSCIREDMGIILQDVGRILGVFLHGFLIDA